MPSWPDGPTTVRPELSDRCHGVVTSPTPMGNSGNGTASGGRLVVAGLKSNRKNNDLISIMLLGLPNRQPHTLPHIFVNRTSDRFSVLVEKRSDIAACRTASGALRPLSVRRQAQPSRSSGRTAEMAQLTKRGPGGGSRRKTDARS